MSTDARIHQIAAKQDGVIHVTQLRALRLDAKAITRRVKDGRLIRVHRGVYAVAGAPLAWAGRARAAVLASRADLSHLACAGTLRVLPHPSGDIDVTRASGSRRSPEGLRVHVAQLDAADRWTRHGLPLTSPTRLILDLAETQPRRIVDRAYNEAQVLRLLTRRQLADAMERWPGRHGLAVLSDLVGDDPGATRSVLEDLFLPLIRDSRLPMPKVNQWVEGQLVDAVWPRQRVVVELDSRTFHDTDPRFESDRARSNALLLKGWLTLRFTYRRLVREPLQVIAELAAALAQGERVAA